MCAGDFGQSSSHFTFVIADLVSLLYIIPAVLRSRISPERVLLQLPLFVHCLLRKTSSLRVICFITSCLLCLSHIFWGQGVYRPEMIGIINHFVWLCQHYFTLLLVIHSSGRSS